MGYIRRSTRLVFVVVLVIVVVAMQPCSGASGRPLISELTDISSIHFHDEDLVLAASTWPGRHEKDLAPVGRPRRSPGAPTRRWIARVLRRRINLLASI